MPTSFGIIKGALRSYSDGEHVHALLELKHLINRERDCWTAYLVRGKVHAALRRYHEAIDDYSRVLQMSENLNARNRGQVQQSSALCAIRLAEKQRNELGEYFKKGAPPRTRKRGLGTKVISTSNAGKIASIGKFLIDAHDLRKLERLLKADEACDPRVQSLSEETGQAFCVLLEKIDRQPGVVGSCIIGRDFFLRANSLPEEYDAEPFGINALAVFLSAGEREKIMEFHKGGQVLMRSDLGTLLMLEFRGLILITLSDETEIHKLVKLASKIARLVR